MIYFLPRCRIALFWALKILKINKKNKILLPSYIGINKKEGSGVFDPVRKLAAGYEFYKVGADLSVDIVDFEKKIKNPKVRAVLIIHYFGFQQKNFKQVLKICKDNQKYLIEDCAHAFNSFYYDKKLDSCGDISVYSIHKFLPTRDGGILKINNASLKAPQNLKDDISRQTLTIFKKSNITKINKTRRENYLYALKKAKSIKGFRIFYPRLEKNIIPLNFPILIEKKDRNEIYFELLKRGIKTVSLYHQIIPQISEKKYPISYFISKRILNLPIHQGINKIGIDRTLKELMNILQNGKL